MTYVINNLTGDITLGKVSLILPTLATDRLAAFLSTKTALPYSAISGVNADVTNHADTTDPVQDAAADGGDCTPSSADCVANVAELNRAFVDPKVGPAVFGADDPIDIRDADLAAEQIADRLNGTLVRDVLNAKTTAGLQAMGDDASFGADDRQYLTPRGRLRLYQQTVARSTVDASIACAHVPDPVLKRNSPYVSKGSSIQKRSGDTLADNLAGAIDIHDDFVVLREVEIPFTQRQFNTAKRNHAKGAIVKKAPGSTVDRRAATSRRLAHKVDILVLDCRNGEVIAIESKRGLGKSDRGQTKRTGARLLAIESNMKEWLESLNITGVKAVRVGVADVYGNSGFAETLQIAGGTFDREFGVRGLDAAMAGLEEHFARETEHAMWKLLLSTLTSYLDAGFGSTSKTAMPSELLAKLGTCWGVVPTVVAPSMETPDPDAPCTLQALATLAVAQAGSAVKVEARV